jgi:hypothetical protein
VRNKGDGNERAEDEILDDGTVLGETEKEVSD